MAKKMPNEKLEPYTVRLPRSVAERLEAVAEAQGLDMTNCIRQVLIYALPEWEQKVAMLNEAYAKEPKKKPEK